MHSWLTRLCSQMLLKICVRNLFQSLHPECWLRIASWIFGWNARRMTLRCFLKRAFFHRSCKPVIAAREDESCHIISWLFMCLAEAGISHSSRIVCMMCMERKLMHAWLPLLSNPCKLHCKTTAAMARPFWSSEFPGRPMC